MVERVQCRRRARATLDAAIAIAIVSPSSVEAIGTKRRISIAFGAIEGAAIPKGLQSFRAEPAASRMIGPARSWMIDSTITLAGAVAARTNR